LLNKGSAKDKTVHSQSEDNMIKIVEILTTRRDVDGKLLNPPVQKTSVTMNVPDRADRRDATWLSRLERSMFDMLCRSDMCGDGPFIPYILEQQRAYARSLISNTAEGSEHGLTHDQIGKFIDDLPGAPKVETMLIKGKRCSWLADNMADLGAVCADSASRG